MTYQEFFDKLSESIFMNIEEVESINEIEDNKSLTLLVKIQSGEKFEVKLQKSA